MNLSLLRYRLVFALSWLSLFAERFWASFWPAVSVVVAFIGLACLKFFLLFGNTAHIALLFVSVAAFYVALVRFGRPFRRPTAHDVRRAIERESELTHRPLEALNDRPVTGTPGETAKLWQKYQERLKKLWSRAKIHRPRPDAGAQDRYSLRFAALLLLVIGLGIAQQETPFRIRQALSPGVKQYFTVKNAALDVWITPPDYTHINPVFLATTQLGATPAKGPFSVPENSLLKVSISGYDEPPVFKYGEKESPFTRASARNYTLEMPLTENGIISIRRWYFDKIGEWPISVVKDKPPEIVMLRAEKTKRDQLKLTYTANDDYRVKSVSGVITPTPELVKQLGAKEIEFDIPTPETGADEQVHTADLTSHPLAGAEVFLTLSARDDLDQLGTSKPFKMTLPERAFTNPIAQQIIFQRKQLIWYNNALTRPIVAQKLYEITGRPDNFKDDKIVFLGLNMAAKRLVIDRSAEASESVIPLLWDLAVRVEDGGLALAQRELSEALAKLAERLRDKTATKEEIEDLMDKVREKSREYARQLARETQQRMKDGKDDPKISQELMDRIMKQIDTEKLMKQMEELTRGSEREQMEKMAEYMKRNIDRLDSRKMEKMQKAQKDTLEGLDDLQKLIERQQKLMDQTNKMLPEKDRFKSEEQKMQEEQKREQEQKQKEEEQKRKESQNQDQQQGQGQQQQQQQSQQGDSGNQGQQGDKGDKSAQQQGQQGGESGQQQGQQGQQSGQQQGQQGQQSGQQQGQQGQQSGQQQGQQDQQAGQQQGQQGQQSGQQQGQQGQQSGQQQGQQGQQSGQQQGQQGQQAGQQQGQQGQQAGQQTGQNGQPMPQPGQNGQPMPGQSGQQGQPMAGQQGQDGQPMPQAGQNAKDGQPMMQPGQNGQQQQMAGDKQGKDGAAGVAGKDENAGGPPQPTADTGFQSAEEKERLRKIGGADAQKDDAAAGGGKKDDKAEQQAAGGAGGDKVAPLKSTGEGAAEQMDIRKQLGDAMRKIGAGLPRIPENFGNADQEMKKSGSSLKGGDAKGSLPNQQEAIEQLQQGMDDAVKQVADQLGDTMVNFGMGQGQGGSGQGGYGDDFDPLGRPMGGQDGRNGMRVEHVDIPDEKERRRVQEIIEELRTRSNDYTRPKTEREYIDRLLNQFE